MAKASISVGRAERNEAAARFLRRKGISSGLTRHSARHGNLKKLDRAARIVNGARPEKCPRDWNS